LALSLPRFGLRVTVESAVTFALSGASLPPNIAQDEERLGGLALQFRGTRRDAERREIAKHYSQTVERLIQSGRWHDAPSRRPASRRLDALSVL